MFLDLVIGACTILVSRAALRDVPRQCSRWAFRHDKGIPSMGITAFFSALALNSRDPRGYIADSLNGFCIVASLC